MTVCIRHGEDGEIVKIFVKERQTTHGFNEVLFAQSTAMRCSRPACPSV